MNKSLVYREIPSVVSVSGFFVEKENFVSPQLKLCNTFNNLNSLSFIHFVERLKSS